MATLRDINEFLLIHEGEPVCLLGNGPTLKDHDLEGLQSAGMKMIGINKSWTEVQCYYHTCVAQEHFNNTQEGLYQPGRTNADGGYEAGIFFITRQRIEYGKLRFFKEWHATLVPIRASRYIASDDYFSADMKMGYHSLFGGQMAIELALWMGFNPIWLLGFDAHNNEGHHHHNVPSSYADRRKQIDLLEPVRPYADKSGVTIYNASLDSAIPWFEKRKLGIRDA